MKTLLSIALLLALLSGAVLFAQPAPTPENLTVYWWPWSTNCEVWARVAPSLSPCEQHEGVWVLVYMTDSTSDAVVITLTYDRGDGKELVSTLFVPRYGSGWVNALFIVGRATVKSISVTPVKIVGPTKQVTPS